MGLPHELLLYAENIFRRFPDVFTTLGAPGLEDVYDLRPNGTMSHCIEETPSGKTVLVKLERRQWACPSLAGWQSLGPASASQYPVPHPGGLWSAGAYGMWPQQLSAAPVPAVPHHNSGTYNEQPPVAITSSLARVEAALSVLAPQVEALRARTAQKSTAAVFHPAQAMHMMQPTTPGAGSSGEPVVSTGAAAQVAPSIKARSLEIPAPAVKNLPMKAASVPVQMLATGAIKNIDGKAKVKPAVVQEQDLAAAVKSKPANIKVPRMSPAFDDPVSPRSPGRYSVWK